MKEKETIAELAAILNLIEAHQAVLIDVREVDEWEKGHVEGAYHYPISLLRKLGEQGFDSHADFLQKLFIPPHDETSLPSSIPSRIYVHCAAGKRAKEGAKKLKEQVSFLPSKPVPLKSSVDDFAAAGFPITSSKASADFAQS